MSPLPNSKTIFVLKTLIIFYFIGRYISYHKYRRNEFKNNEIYRQYRRFWLIAIGLEGLAHAVSTHLILGYGYGCAGVLTPMCSPDIMAICMLAATMAFANIQSNSSRSEESVFIFFSIIVLILALWAEISVIYFDSLEILHWLFLLLPFFITVVFYKAPVFERVKTQIINIAKYFTYLLSFGIDLIFFANGFFFFILAD